LLLPPDSLINETRRSTPTGVGADLLDPSAALLLGAWQGPFDEWTAGKEHAVGDKGQKDKDKNKQKMIKKRQDKAQKAKVKNQKPA
jgi:hypothetical protein